MSKFTGRERAILTIGILIGLGLAATTHIAEAGGAVRALNYPLGQFHDPMMPQGYKAPSFNNAIDLSDWRIGAVISAGEQKMAYVDETILRVGSHYRGVEIVDITLTELTVRRGDKTVVWPIPEISFSSASATSGDAAQPAQTNAPKALFQKKLIDLNEELK